MATRQKAAGKKPAGKKATAKPRRKRTRPVPVPMPQSVRAAAYAALTRFEEALANEPDLGLNTTSTRTLKSGGLQKMARIEIDGKTYRAVAVVRLREASNGGRRRRRQTEDDEE